MLMYLNEAKRLVEFGALVFPWLFFLPLPKGCLWHNARMHQKKHESIFKIMLMYLNETKH